MDYQCMIKIHPFHEEVKSMTESVLLFALPAQQTPCKLTSIHYNCIVDICQNQPSFQTNS